MKCYSFLALAVLFLLLELLFSGLLRLGRLRCLASRSLLRLEQLRNSLTRVHLEEGKVIQVLSFRNTWDLHSIVPLHGCFNLLLGFFFSIDLLLLGFVFWLWVVESLRELEGLLLLEHHDELFLGESGQVERLGLRFCLGHAGLLCLHLRTLALGDLLGRLAASLLDLFILVDLLGIKVSTEIAEQLLHIIWFILWDILKLLCDILLTLELLLHVAHCFLLTLVLRLSLLIHRHAREHLLGRTVRVRCHKRLVVSTDLSGHAC